MHKSLILIGTLILLGACGQGTPPATESPLAMPSLTGWADVMTENINVPEGVAFAPIDLDGTRVMEIGGVPDAALSTQRTGGVSVLMPAEFEDRASGNQILVTVRAYSEQEGARLGLAYSTNDVGNSGWLTFALTNQPTDYTFIYNVPAKRAGLGDYLGIRSYGSQAVRVVGFQTMVLDESQSTQLDGELRATQGE